VVLPALTVDFDDSGNPQLTTLENATTECVSLPNHLNLGPANVPDVNIPGTPQWLQDTLQDLVNSGGNIDLGHPSSAPQTDMQEVTVKARHLNPCEKDTLSPYIAAPVLDAAVIHAGGLSKLLLPGYTAVTIGNNIYFRPGVYDPSMAAGLAVLGHELVHVGQYQNGMTLPGYLWSTRKGYYNSPYEQAAYAAQATILSDLSNSGFQGCLNPNGQFQ
jgi:hypothetical protein